MKKKRKKSSKKPKLERVRILTAEGWKRLAFPFLYEKKEGKKS